MTKAWYQVASLSFGYLSAGIIAMIVFFALRRLISDRALWGRVHKNLPRAGAAGVLCVQSSNHGRRLSAGQEIRLPYEGTLGSLFSCDVCIPHRKVHMRSAFFWMDGDELHMVPLHRDGFVVDDVPVEPGDEAVLRNGAVLELSGLKLVLRLFDKRMPLMSDGPYVTPARRNEAQKGRGDGLGRPGRRETRRARRQRAQEEADEKQEQKNARR